MNHLHSILKIQRVNIMRKLRLLPCALFVLLAFLSSAMQAQGVQTVPVVSRSVERKVDLPGEFLPYESLAIQLALAAGGLIAWASMAKIDARLAARLVRVAQLAFGICALVFGTAHFVYMDLTAPLVPHWLPPNQEFWAYATGVAHIAAGIAIITHVQARLAAVLLTVMFASFTPLVHLPMLLATPSSHWIWNENAVNIALIGAAWVVADSLARRR